MYICSKGWWGNERKESPLCLPSFWLAKRACPRLFHAFMLQAERGATAIFNSIYRLRIALAAAATFAHRRQSAYSHQASCHNLL